MSELLKISIKNTGSGEFDVIINDIHPDNLDVKLLESGEYAQYQSLESYSLALLLETASKESNQSSFVKEYAKLCYIADYGSLDDDYAESGYFDSSYSINQDVIPLILNSAKLISTENSDFWSTAMEKYGDNVFLSDQQDKFIKDYPTAIIKIILKSNTWDSFFNNLCCYSGYSISL
jgi:hypothetical protein